MASPKKKDVPIVEEIGIILTKSYKGVLEKNFAIEKCEIGWKFTQNLPDVGIKINDILLGIDSKDIRNEPNTEAIFSKCFVKSVNDAIFFMIIRSQYRDQGKHLAKKVRTKFLQFQ